MLICMQVRALDRIFVFVCVNNNNSGVEMIHNSIYHIIIVYIGIVILFYIVLFLLLLFQEEEGKTNYQYLIIQVNCLMQLIDSLKRH